MKKLLVTFAAVIISAASAYAQASLGQITVVNNGLSDPANPTGPLYNAPIGGDTTGASAQLFLVGSGGALTALTPTTTFRTGAASPYLSAVNVDVPGTVPGGSATFVLKAWSGGASYDTATTKGQSAQFTVAGLGGTPAVGAPLTPPKLNGLQSFALAAVPEPSTIALAALGAAAMFIRRRK